ncbi:unnamed protein product [Ostreobium quekettii]|uniref:Amino acid transporter transmembrane domain-containing protein n=1 Tax=Ostreobium quekettii TaxID=121088 RepID=A0A8S1J7G9_9CHLO|nr:unnamed protein product [Ostreobium quekettii]|eukprot:evm.model.scf_324.4 EVM.evm.TU.scf_324.4   scf_324:54086-61256(-)
MGRALGGGGQGGGGVGSGRGSPMGPLRIGARPDTRVVQVDDTTVPLLDGPEGGGEPRGFFWRPILFSARRKIGDVDCGAAPPRRSIAVARPPPATAPLEGRSSVNGTAFNLMNTMIGAGLMALPRVYAMMGIILSVFMTIVVATFMYLCSAVLVRAADRSSERTYTELARSQLGSWAGFIVQCSIILNNAGILLVYLIIIGDLMVGTQSSGYHGLVTSWFGIHPEAGKLPWYLSRWFSVMMVCIVFLGPLVFQKRLHVLAHTSTFAIGLATAFAVATTLLAVVVGFQGKFDKIPWGMDPSIKEPDMHKNCIAAVVMTGVPVLLYAFVYLFNVPPLMAELRDYSRPRMIKAVRISIVSTTILYIVVGVSASLVFGDETKQDILVNLNPKALGAFMGPDMAETLSSLVALGYAGKLILIFPLGNWSLRENLSDLAFGTQRPTGWRFNVMTAAILVAMYVMSLMCGSVLNAIDIIGCTAAVGISFIIPAWLIQRFEPSGCMKAFGAAVWVVGMFCLVEGLVGEMWRMVYQAPLFC